VDVRKLRRFTLDEEKLPPLQEKYFVRRRSIKKEIFNGPHLLIKQSPRVGVGLIAALLKNDAVFRDSILGIHGKESDLDYLAACCLFINANISLYYELLTSRRWLVERDELQKEEIMDLPMPERIFSLKKINYKSLKEISENPEADRIVNQLATELYHLDESELIQINDLIKITLDYFVNKNRSTAIKPTNKDILTDYTNTFCSELNDSISNSNKIFVGTIYDGEGPLSVISARLIEKSEKLHTPYILDNQLNNILDDLNTQLIEELSQSIYMRRNLRRYSGDAIFIIKPNQRRF